MANTALPYLLFAIIAATKYTTGTVNRLANHNFSARMIAYNNAVIVLSVLTSVTSFILFIFSLFKLHWWLVIITFILAGLIATSLPIHRKLLWWILDDEGEGEGYLRMIITLFVVLAAQLWLFYLYI